MRWTSLPAEAGEPLEHGRECQPRSSPAKAWISSMTTARSPRNSSLGGHAPAHQHHLERLGRGQQDVGRVADEAAAGRLAPTSPCHLNARRPTARVALEPRLLVVEERPDRARRRAPMTRRPVLGVHAREQREERRLGLAAGGRREHDAVLARRGSASMACSWTGRSAAKPSALTIWYWSAGAGDRRRRSCVTASGVAVAEVELDVVDAARRRPRPRRSSGVSSLGVEQSSS